MRAPRRIGVPGRGARGLRGAGGPDGADAAAGGGLLAYAASPGRCRAEGVDVEGVDLQDPIGNGIVANDVNSARVGATTAVSVLGAGAGVSIDVNGGDGQLDFGRTSVSAGRGDSVSVTGRSGGTVSFGGAISNSAAGISLVDNAGAAVNFTGTLTLNGESNPAFTATGGGTVTATGAGSTLTATDGTALNVQSTTIGAAGLNFQAISSDGGSPGIDLDDTGSAGGLTVTGTGAPGSGGTIANAADEGIELSSTSDPSFTDMLISGNAADGINGVQVDGLTPASSTVSGNGTPGDVVNDQTNEDGLDFVNGLTGTVSITNSTTTGSADNDAIITDGSGTLSLTVTADTFSDNNASAGSAGLELNTNGTSATVTAGDNDFQNVPTNDIQITAIGGTLTGTINDNTIGTPTVADSGGTAGLQLIVEGAGTGTLTVSGNHIYQYDNLSGLYFEAGDGAAVLNLTATGNTIADPGTFALAGIMGINGARAGDSGTVCAAISGNSIAESGKPALGGADIWLQQYDQTSFELPGYTGGATDAGAIESFLQASNNANGTPTASVQLANGFTGGSSC